MRQPRYLIPSLSEVQVGAYVYASIPCFRTVKLDQRATMPDHFDYLVFEADNNNEFYRGMAAAHQLPIVGIMSYATESPLAYGYPRYPTLIQMFLATGTPLSTILRLQDVYLAEKDLIVMGVFRDLHKKGLLHESALA